MEHTTEADQKGKRPRHRLDHTSREVIARFVRRRWKAPLLTVGATGVALLLMGAMPSPLKGKRPVTPVGGPELGVVESLYTKGVGSPWSGTLEGLQVRAGQKVKKGDLLFRMDTSQLRTDLNSAKLARASFAEQIQGLKLERAQALRDLDREIAALNAELGNALRSQPVPTPEWEGEEADEGEAEDGAQVRGEGWVDAALPAESGLVESLRVRLADAYARRQSVSQQWQEEMAPAAQAMAEYDGQIRSLKAQLNTAVRKSPAEGVVTAVYAQAGAVLPQGQPVVRIDNPSGYRVVTLVEAPVKDRLPVGTQLPAQSTGQTKVATLAKVVPGWDKELFKYYLWWKPNAPETLAPGQQVKVELPSVNVASATR